MLPSRLYVVCDADVCASAGWTIPDFASSCLDGGARILQVRAKGMAGRSFLEVVHEVVARSAGYRALVIVNDRADIARLTSAGGIHVGQDDLPPAAVRAIVGPTAVVGLSTHTVSQVEAAVREPIDYLAIGPVFSTTTKATGHEAVGLAGVSAADRASARRLPIVAIGGITLDRSSAVIAAGAAAVAVISDLLTTGNPASRVREYLTTLE